MCTNCADELNTRNRFLAVGWQWVWQWVWQWTKKHGNGLQPANFLVGRRRLKSFYWPIPTMCE